MQRITSTCNLLVDVSPSRTITLLDPINLRQTLGAMIRASGGFHNLTTLVKD